MLKATQQTGVRSRPQTSGVCLQVDYIPPLFSPSPEETNPTAKSGESAGEVLPNIPNPIPLPTGPREPPHLVSLRFPELSQYTPQYTILPQYTPD